MSSLDEASSIETACEIHKQLFEIQLKTRHAKSIFPALEHIQRDWRKFDQIRQRPHTLDTVLLQIRSFQSHLLLFMYLDRFMHFHCFVRLHWFMSNHLQL